MSLGGRTQSFEIAHGYEETVGFEGSQDPELTHVIAVRPRHFDAEVVAERIRRLYPSVGVELDVRPDSNSVELILDLSRKKELLKSVRDLARRTLAKYSHASEVTVATDRPVKLEDLRSVFEVVDQQRVESDSDRHLA
jgi:hypothetical protein